MKRLTSHPAAPLIFASMLLVMSACTPEERDETPQEDMSASSADADMLTIEDAAPDLADEGAPDMAQEEMSIDMADMPDLEEVESPDLVIPPRPWDINEQGPYNVGYMTTEMTFIVRPSMEARTLKVVFWYPTLKTSGKRAKYLGLLARPKIYGEPEVAPEPERFPMLVFSHGNGSIAEQSYFMTERFASHGWIVMAPYHTNNSLYDNPSAINYLSAVDRPQDIRALLDWAEELPAELPLAGRIDMDRIAMSGHSFGGFTTMANAGATFAVDSLLEQCDQGALERKYCDLFTEERVEVFRDGFLDTRIKAAIPHAPGVGPFFEEGVAQIDIPLLMMTAGRDQALPADENGDYMWARMNDGKHARFDLPNGGHFTYSNMCGLLGGVEQAADDGCNETFIPEEVALPMINLYSLAWAEYHVLGDTRHEALLTGELRPFDEADLHYEVKAGMAPKN